MDAVANPRVVLRPKRAKPFYDRHPWMFAGAVERVEGEPADGGAVDVVSTAGHFVARGLFNSRSRLRVRLYTWNESETLDRPFFCRRLEAAVRLRHDVLKLHQPGAAYRLVSSEADGLPGLIVDRYGDWLSAQFTALGMAERRVELAEDLAELTGVRGVYLRTERGVGQLEGLELHDGPLWGEVPDGPVEIVEDGLTFLVNVREGQKTGAYLDQRLNRKAVADYCVGRSVLDCFCYGGGFSLYAARAGAAAVEGLDVSEPALQLARRNAERNGLTATFTKAEIFDELAARAERGDRYGVVVLDPPKFARSRQAVPEALRGYQRLQSLAVKLLEPDGVLVMCCCSGLIDFAMLEDVLARVAVERRRFVQILERRGPSPDHPVAVTCPESGYLKCLMCRVA